MLTAKETKVFYRNARRMKCTVIQEMYSYLVTIRVCIFVYMNVRVRFVAGKQECKGKQLTWNHIPVSRSSCVAHQSTVRDNCHNYVFRPILWTGACFEHAF